MLSRRPTLSPRLRGSVERLTKKDFLDLITFDHENYHISFS